MQTIPLFSAVSVLLLAGCATTISPNNAAKLNIARSGLVLVTWETGASNPGRTIIDYAEVRLQQVSGEGREMEKRVIKSTQPLSLIELRPGRYRIADFRLASGILILDGPLGHQEAGNVFEFEVRPGEVTYLGNLHPFSESTILSDRYIFRASLVLQDRCGSTVALFRQEYPALSTVRVRDAAPRLIAWDLLPKPDMDFAEGHTSGPHPTEKGLETRFYFTSAQDPKNEVPTP